VVKGGQNRQKLSTRKKKAKNTKVEMGKGEISKEKKKGREERKRKRRFHSGKNCGGVARNLKEGAKKKRGGDQCALKTSMGITGETKEEKGPH